MSISVCTIVKGREKHLRNQLRGLLQSDLMPAEWIIVGMGEEPPQLQCDAFPIITTTVDCSDHELPLAAARNKAAMHASQEKLVFLDVDCIPAPDLLEGFRNATDDAENLWMGSVGYLPANATDQSWTFDDLEQAAEKHPAMPSLDAGETMVWERYEMFWSLCFALHRRTFVKIGGFDESFTGYGAEDTDLGFTARLKGVRFGMIGEKAYHQHHAVCKPPINHLVAIVENAQRFRAKWRTWPMTGWLNAFEDLGYVDFAPELDYLEIVRVPTDAEIEEATALTPAGF